MKKDWWKTFFGENYLLFWGEKGAFGHTKKEINFLVKHIPIRRKDKILDLCCGHGRHTLELAKRGFAVAGLDYSRFELDLASKAADEKGLRIDFREGDARNFQMNRKFNVVINMFTAFGYGSKADDQKILRSASRHLARGGKFLIDLVSMIWILRNFRARQTERLGKNAYALIAREFDPIHNTNLETRTIVKGGKKEASQLRLRLYSLPEIIEMLAAAGLRYEKSWGSFDAKPYGLDSKRMIVLAKKV